MSKLELRKIRVGNWEAEFNDDDLLLVTDPDGDTVTLAIRNRQEDLDDLAMLIVTMAATGERDE